MAVIPGRADRFIVRRRVGVFNESEAALQLVAAGRAREDFSESETKKLICSEFFDLIISASHMKVKKISTRNF